MIESMSMIAPKVQEVIRDPENWLVNGAPEHCALCGKIFREWEIPFSLWREHDRERLMISFHLKCALGDACYDEDVSENPWGRALQ
jgi:hypothetical protein